MSDADAALIGLVVGQWLALGAWWACLMIGHRRDRRLMRRLNAQPWWPPTSTKLPTTAEPSRHRVG